jgi:hypothetical protein
LATREKLPDNLEYTLFLKRVNKKKGPLLRALPNRLVARFV